MAPPPGPLTEPPRRGGFVRYLLDGERIVTAVHQHWAMVAEPVASVVVGLVVVLALDSSMPSSLGLLVNLLWWGWLFLVGRAVWKFLEWRHDWFVATDNRLILTYGLITRKVAMMPLAKVTDMSYNRSPVARLLGYGTFVMESAGQDQALHKVRWVANPDHTYRAICAEIFGVDDHERVLPLVEQERHDDRFGPGPSEQPLSGSAHLPSPYAGFVPPEDNAGLPNRPDTADHSTAIRVRRSEQGDGAGEADRRRGHNDQDDNDPTRSPDDGSREADTGPIPVWRPGTD